MRKDIDNFIQTIIVSVGAIILAFIPGYTFLMRFACITIGIVSLIMNFSIVFKNKNIIKLSVFLSKYYNYIYMFFLIAESIEHCSKSTDKKDVYTYVSFFIALWFVSLTLANILKAMLKLLRTGFKKINGQIIKTVLAYYMKSLIGFALVFSTIIYFDSNALSNMIGLSGFEKYTSILLFVVQLATNSNIISIEPMTGIAKLLCVVEVIFYVVIISGAIAIVLNKYFTQAKKISTPPMKT